MDQDVLRNTVYRNKKLEAITVFTSSGTVSKLWYNHTMECHRRAEKAEINMYSLPQKSAHGILLNLKDRHKTACIALLHLFKIIRHLDIIRKVPEMIHTKLLTVVIFRG